MYLNMFCLSYNLNCMMNGMLIVDINFAKNYYISLEIFMKDIL